MVRALLVLRPVNAKAKGGNEKTWSTRVFMVKLPLVGPSKTRDENNQDVRPFELCIYVVLAGGSLVE